MTGQSRPRNRTFVVVRECGGYTAVSRVDAPRIDAAMVVILGHGSVASRIVYIGNGVHKYETEDSERVTTYYVVDVEAMRAEA